MKHSVSGSSTIRTKPLLRLGDYHSVLGSTIEWLLKTWHTVYRDPAYLSSPESDDSLELDDLSFVGGGDAGILPVAGSLSSSTHFSCQTATACTSSHSTSGDAFFVFFNTLSIICPLCFLGSLFLPFAIDPCGKILFACPV